MSFAGGHFDRESPSCLSVSLRGVATFNSALELCRRRIAFLTSRAQGRTVRYGSSVRSAGRHLAIG